MKRSFLILLLCTSGSGCDDKASRPVEAQIATRGARPTSRDADSANSGYVAVIAPKRTAVVAPEISARVEKVFVRMGDTVKKGNPIVALDGKSIRDELTSARAAAAGARAANTQASLEVANASREYSVEQRLNRQGVSSSETVKTARITMQKAGAARAQAGAEAARAQADVDRLERALNDSTLRAPIDGVVSLLRAREGDLVTSGQNVVRILAPGDWQLRFAVPSKEASKLAQGQRVLFTIDDDVTSKPIAATVSHVAPELEPPLQLVVVEAEFDEEAQREPLLRAGRVGKVRHASAQKTSIKLPGGL